MLNGTRVIVKVFLYKKPFASQHFSFQGCYELPYGLPEEALCVSGNAPKKLISRISSKEGSLLGSSLRVAVVNVATFVSIREVIMSSADLQTKPEENILFRNCGIKRIVSCKTGTYGLWFSCSNSSQLSLTGGQIWPSLYLTARACFNRIVSAPARDRTSGALCTLVFTISSPITLIL